MNETKQEENSTNPARGRVGEVTDHGFGGLWFDPSLRTLLLSSGMFEIKLHYNSRVESLRTRLDIYQFSVTSSAGVE